jgi:hypothetical protein
MHRLQRYGGRLFLCVNVYSESTPMRFPIRFDAAYKVLSYAVLIPPSDSYLEISGDQIHVRMAWAFRAKFSRLSVASTTRLNERPLSRGVHGFSGRWLNGSGDGILVIDLKPVERGYVMGFPVRLKQLMVSVDEPVALAAALGQSTTSQAHSP